MREDGMTPRDAILESVRTRIRPIFMTTDHHGARPAAAGAVSRCRQRALPRPGQRGARRPDRLDALHAGARAGLFSLMMDIKSIVSKFFSLGRCRRSRLPVQESDKGSKSPSKAAMSLSENQPLEGDSSRNGLVI